MATPATTPAEIADAIDAEIRALDPATTATIRQVRRAHTAALKERPGAEVLAVASALVDRQRWVAYELVHHHRDARASLDEATVEALAAGLDGWGGVDAFGRYVAGPAWQDRTIGDEVIQRWTTSPDRWRRRAALVATVPLNLASAGGTGDTARTLDICLRLVDDRDDMVVKALSWALRELVRWDPAAVRTFLDEQSVAARVRREVISKLETGLKQRPRAGSRKRPRQQTP